MQAAVHKMMTVVTCLVTLLLVTTGKAVSRRLTTLFPLLAGGHPPLLGSGERVRVSLLVSKVAAALSCQGVRLLVCCTAAAAMLRVLAVPTAAVLLTASACPCTDAARL